MTTISHHDALGGDDLEPALEVVVRAGRMFAAVTAESIARAGEGITLPQLRVLVIASTDKTLNNSQVATALGVHISNASRICDRLVQAGLLARRDSPVDRRHVELTLTDRGTSLLAAVTEHRRQIYAAILREVPASQRKVLSKSLAAFADVAERQLENRIRRTP